MNILFGIFYTLYIIIAILAFGLVGTVIAGATTNLTSIWLLYILGGILIMIGTVLLWNIGDNSSFIRKFATFIIILTSVGFALSSLSLYLMTTMTETTTVDILKQIATLPAFLLLTGTVVASLITMWMANKTVGIQKVN